jgi:hypothetical protein
MIFADARPRLWGRIQVLAPAQSFAVVVLVWAKCRQYSISVTVVLLSLAIKGVVTVVVAVYGVAVCRLFISDSHFERPIWVDLGDAASNGSRLSDRPSGSGVNFGQGGNRNLIMTLDRTGMKDSGQKAEEDERETRIEPKASLNCH